MSINVIKISAATSSRHSTSGAWPCLHNPGQSSCTEEHHEPSHVMFMQMRKCHANAMQFYHITDKYHITHITKSYMWGSWLARSCRHSGRFSEARHLGSRTCFSLAVLVLRLGKTWRPWHIARHRTASHGASMAYDADDDFEFEFTMFTDLFWP